MKRPVAAAALLALSLAGCGNSPVQAGAAATVGDQRITTTALDKVVTRGLADPTAQQNVGADRPAFVRVVLRRLIDHDILATAAAKEGVTVSRGESLAARTRIADQIGGEDGLNAEALKAGIALADLDQTIRDVALRDALGDKLTASIAVPNAVLANAYRQNINEFDKVHSAHILVATMPEAQSILGQVKADPSRFAALAAAHSTDPGSKAKGGDLGFQSRGVLDKGFERAIFTNPPGSFVIVHTQFGFHVIHVIEHLLVTLEQAKPQLRRNLLGQQRSDAVQELMVATAKRLNIHVNPRFGTWDLNALDVVAVPNGPHPVTSQSPRPGASPSGEPGPIGP